MAISDIQKANHFISNINKIIEHFIDVDNENVCYLTAYNDFWIIPEGMSNPIEIIRYNANIINNYIITTMLILSHMQYVPFCLKAYLNNIKSLALELQLNEINVDCIDLKKLRNPLINGKK